MLSGLIEKIASGLEREGIEYMVLGGQTVLLFGEPRLTKDIDITLGVGPESLEKILGLLKDIDLEILIRDTVEFVRRTMVLPAKDKQTGFRVDLIFSDSIYEKEA